jgi:hypothetical protein
MTGQTCKHYNSYSNKKCPIAAGMDSGFKFFINLEGLTV